MSFRIVLDKYERAYGALVRAVQTAIQTTFAEEARDRGLTQADLARELNLDPSIVSRRLNGSGNYTLRSVSDIYTAMGREPLSGFRVPEPKFAVAGAETSTASSPNHTAAFFALPVGGDRTWQTNAGVLQMTPEGSSFVNLPYMLTAGLATQLVNSKKESSQLMAYSGG